MAHRGHPSAASLAYDSESTLAEDRRSTNCATQPAVLLRPWSCKPSYTTTTDCLALNSGHPERKKSNPQNVKFHIIYKVP